MLARLLSEGARVLYPKTRCAPERYRLCCVLVALYKSLHGPVRDKLDLLARLLSEGVHTRNLQPRNLVIQTTPMLARIVALRIAVFWITAQRWKPPSDFLGTEQVHSLPHEFVPA